MRPKVTEGFLPLKVAMVEKGRETDGVAGMTQMSSW